MLRVPHRDRAGVVSLQRGRLRREGGRRRRSTGPASAAPWPLLAGERAHYELAAGRPDVAVQLLGVMRAQASDGGMLPEQVWDGADIPERELFNGRPTGSAMPLVWAHAEYAKLVRSLHDGRVFDMPQQPYERYVRAGTPAGRTLGTACRGDRSRGTCRRARLPLRQRVALAVYASSASTTAGARRRRRVWSQTARSPGLLVPDFGSLARR